jgi:O-antigen ligase
VDFLVFLLVNAVLFIRPQEIMADFPVENPYVLLIALNLVICARPILARFSIDSLHQDPLLVGVVGLFAAIVLSQLSHFKFSMAKEGAVDFGKVVLYYTLLISVVRTPIRLQRFLAALVVFTSVLCAMALLQYYGVIHIEALESVGDREIDPETGNEFVLMRLCSTGVFHDPNDLACIVIAASWMSVYLSGDRKLGPFRFLWLTPILLFADAFSKTHSRGGFLGLAGSLVVMLIGRYGGRKAIPYLALGVPVLLVLFAGRATSISASDDTGQDRIRLWSEGFDLLKSSPFFGIGWEVMDDEVGLVAHNSFIHGFVELGIFGGPLFLGLFYCGLNGLYSLRNMPTRDVDPELVRMRPYLMAIVSGYAICLLTLTRNYVVPTYMIVGLAAAYLGIVAKHSKGLLPACDGQFAWRIYKIGIAFLILANLFTRAFVRHG